MVIQCYCLLALVFYTQFFFASFHSNILQVLYISASTVGRERECSNKQNTIFAIEELSPVG